MREVSLRLLADLTIDERLESIATLPDTAARQRELAKSTGKDRKAHRERAEELEAEWSALVADIEAHGIREPLILVGDVIIDGRHRYYGAKEAGIFEVPTVQVPAEQASAIIFSAVIARRHFSKSALAYTAVITHPQVASAGQGSRSDLGTSVLNTEVLAKKAGCSRAYIEKAAELFRITASYPAIRRDCELAIYSGSGLLGVISHAKARLAGRDTKSAPEKGRYTANYDDLGPSAGRTLGAAFAHWQNLSPEAREKTVENTVEGLMKAPEDIRASIIQRLSSKP